MSNDLVIVNYAINDSHDWILKLPRKTKKALQKKGVTTFSTNGINRILNNTKMNDNTILTFGSHKGKKLADVPASWFLWYADTATGRKDEKLLAYIEDNRMALMQEADLDRLKKNK